MRTFFKLVVMVVVVLVLINVAQKVLGGNLIDFLSKHFGGSKLGSTTVTVGQETLIPKFEIVSLEIFYPKNVAVIQVDKFEWWRLNIGKVYYLIEYDTFIKLGVKNPDLIKPERIDNTIYVDESMIVIELLDSKLENFEHKGTFKSNMLVISNEEAKYVLLAINELQKELGPKIIENGQPNFEYAKKNFKANYESLCRGMGLDVVWRGGEKEENHGGIYQ